MTMPRRTLVVMLALAGLAPSAFAAGDAAVKLRRPSDLATIVEITSEGYATFKGTVTAEGQDSNGFSLKTSSGIDASNGCITLEGGQVCGPTGTGGGGGIGVSSDVANGFSGTTSDTVCRTCAPGSTVTISGVSSGSDLFVRINGPIFNGSSVNKYTLFHDGDFVPPATASQGFILAGTVGQQTFDSIGYGQWIRGVSSGSHSFCLVICAAGGTAQWGQSASGGNSQSAVIQVQEFIP